MPDEGINPVELPEIMAHVWGWFLILHRKRGREMGGPLPIAESEIGWFFRNRGLSPSLWEMDALTELDRIALEKDGGDAEEGES